MIAGRPLVRVLGALGLFLSGCAVHSPFDRDKVSRGVEARSGHGLRPAKGDASVAKPAGVNLSDGLTEDEAVALALWNSPGFGATLATLGFARADLQEAGFLRNPIFSLLFPLGPKQLEFTLNWPIEAIWQRPRRVKAAKIELERMAESLVQSGLDVVRDARLAHGDLLLAQQRLRLAIESARLRGELGRIAESRLTAGDTSEMETNPLRIDAARADEDRARFAYEAQLAEMRLRSLLGLAEDPEPFVMVESESAVTTPADVGGLIRRALAARPDVRAAELAMEAAAAKAGWERSKLFAFTATLDANAQGKEGFEMGPGFQIELPIFNRNRAGVARAHAEIERAAWQYVDVQRRVALQVREACLLLAHVREALEILRLRVLPLVEQEVRRAEKIYGDGQVPHLFVLEATRQRLDAGLREAELMASARRARALLEHGTGGKSIDKP